MAKVKYGGGIADVRGSFAGQTHSRNTYGNYIRQKVSPVQPRSQKQLELRSIFGQLPTRYANLLTDEQLEGWRQLAASVPTRDVFGDSIQLTGINLYVALNSNRLLAGLPILDDPPVFEEVPAPEGLQLNSAGTNLEVSLSPSPSQYATMVWATKPLSPGKAFVENELRLLTVVPAGTNWPYDLAPQYSARFGPIQLGTRIWVAVRYMSEAGWTSPRVLGSIRIQLG